MLVQAHYYLGLSSASKPTLEDEKKIIMMADFADLATRYDHIPDPYYEGAEGFELVLDLLESACANLYDNIK